MCGIAGYIRFGKKKPSKVILDNLLIETESRGRDSTGVSFIKDGKLVVIKSPGKASDFVVDNEEWKKLNSRTLPDCMIMHCRAGTQGSEDDNKNNHPVYRDGLAVVHNGVIYNDDALYEEFEFKRDGEVDTEIILALLESQRDDAWVDRVEGMSKLRGHFAVASIDTHHPDTLCLFRHSRPLSVAVDTKDDILYFASTRTIIEDAVVENYRNIVDIEKELAHWTMKDNAGIILNREGLVDAFTMDITSCLTRTAYENSIRKPYRHTGSSTTGNSSASTKGSFSLCSSCEQEAECIMFCKNTLKAHDCGSYSQKRAIGFIGTSGIEQVDTSTSDDPNDFCINSCEHYTDCENMGNDELNLCCPLLVGMAKYEDTDSSDDTIDCNQCDKGTTCSTAFNKSPFECAEFADKESTVH